MLLENLASIRTQSVPSDIVIVGPVDDPVIGKAAKDFDARLVADPGSLPGAINVGVDCREPRHEFVNWLGDDDLLEAGSLATTTAALDRDPSAVLAYGACRYIDDSGAELWISRAGRWAPRILSWGPDLIPQPGMLVRVDAWAAVGGLDESFRFAFDLDLLLKLRRLGELVSVPDVVAAFRWHGDSLTVADRTTNLVESERAKGRALAPMARRFSWLWRRPVRAATRLAAWEVSRRARAAAPVR